MYQRNASAAGEALYDFRSPVIRTGENSFTVKTIRVGAIVVDRRR